MAYTPTEWKTGDVVTAAKLNNMENGIAGATAMIIHLNEQNAMDKTWLEIKTAYTSGTPVIIVDSQDNAMWWNWIVTFVGLIESTYTVMAHYFEMDQIHYANFDTDNENGYPIKPT